MSSVSSVRVAVASRSFSTNPLLRRELLDRYPCATFNSEDRVLAGDDLIMFLHGHERAIIGLERLDSGVFAAVPELRVVSKYGVGLDTIDLRAMEAFGVRLGWTPGVNRRSVAELVISAAIALLHQSPVASRELGVGVWRQVVGRQLSDRVVGVIGCGHVGQDVARLVRAFGCSVLAHDIREYSEFYRAYEIEPVDLETLLQRAEVVTLHVPLDETTRRMLDARRLDLLKRNAILINMARGGLLDEIALKERLKAGRLAGAALDVFETEPPGDRELATLPNVIATPHIGGSTEEAILAMGRAAVAGLEKANLPGELSLL